MTDWLLPLAAGFGAGILSAWGGGGGGGAACCCGAEPDMVPDRFWASSMIRAMLPGSDSSAFSLSSNSLMPPPPPAAYFWTAFWMRSMRAAPSGLPIT